MIHPLRTTYQLNLSCKKERNVEVSICPIVTPQNFKLLRFFLLHSLLEVRVGIKPQPRMEFRFFFFISPGITSNTEIDQAIVN